LSPAATTLYSRHVIHGMSPIVARVDTGTAELVPDRDGGWTLLLDGVEQSYVDPHRPRRLGFAYLRRLARVLDTIATAQAPQRVLHLGGGAMTLPRYVAATRPGSPQRVVEHDGALAALIQRVLPTPVDIVVEVADARTFLATILATTAEQFDVVVADVYQGAHMPPSVSSVGFARDVAQVLAPHGVLAVNVTDLPPLTLSRVYAATLRATFTHVCLIAEAGLLRGRRYGNTVLAASRQPLPVARLAHDTAHDEARARVLYGNELDDFIGATGPRHDA
jgi:spermidine synthase